MSNIIGWCVIRLDRVEQGVWELWKWVGHWTGVELSSLGVSVWSPTCSVAQQVICLNSLMALWPRPYEYVLNSACWATTVCEGSKETIILCSLRFSCHLCSRIHFPPFVNIARERKEWRKGCSYFQFSLTWKVTLAYLDPLQFPAAVACRLVLEAQPTAFLKLATDISYLLWFISNSSFCLKRHI